MASSSCPFPENFTRGVAAAPPIEGAAVTNANGESVWDRFCRQQGQVRHRDTLAKRTFDVGLVGKDKPAGYDSLPGPDRTLHYRGESATFTFK